MNITVAAIGKLKKGPELELVQRYQKRLKWSVKVLEQAEAPARLTVEERKEREAEFLLQPLKRTTTLVALDETGKVASSEDFAKLIDNIGANKGPELLFVIGGPDGLAPSILSESDHLMSLGRLTWPHQIARALLMEQLYRAQTILDHHPYHRQ